MTAGALPFSRSDRHLAVVAKHRIHGLHERAIQCAAAASVTLCELFQGRHRSARRARVAFARELLALGWTQARIVPFLDLPSLDAATAGLLQP